MPTELRVLIVEDSEDDALLLVEMIRRGGYIVQWTRVDTARDMEAALASQDFHVILCDYTLPQFDAPSALRIVHAHNLDIPFIVVSGTIGEDVAAEMMRVGAHDYVMKGNLQRLLPAIGRELRDAEARHGRKVARHAQLQSESRFRSLFECSPTPIVISRMDDGTILRANQAFARAFGGDQLGLVGHSVTEFHATPEDQSRVVQSVMDRGVVYGFEFKVRGLDATEHWVVANMELMELAGEQVIISGWTEITEQKKAEETLRRHRELLVAIQESTESAIFSIDRDYKYTSFNKVHARTMKALFGVEIEIGGNILDYHTDANDRELCRQNLDRALRGERFTVESFSGDAALSRQYFEIIHNPIYGEDGQCQGVSVAASEISNRKQAQEQLVESRQMLQMVIDQLPGFVFWKDHECAYLGCNQKFAEWAGVKSSADIVGKTDDDLPGRKENADRYREADRRVMDSACFECHIIEQEQGTDGQGKWLDVSRVPLRDKEGNVTGILGIYFDASERIAAEQEKAQLELQLRQSQKLETIGTLAGGIAHDFNNILTPILVYSEMATGILDQDHPVRDDLIRVIESANRAKDLVKQILTFSRQTEQEHFPIELSPIIREALKLLRASIPTTIEISDDIDPKCGTVLGDPSQIHQVLMNLCTNAYSAMRDTGGLLTVTMKPCTVDESLSRAHSELLPGDYVRLTVSDTGCGMDRQTADRIFEPFFTTKPVGEGTGLGLSVVHGIVSGHGGAMIVHTEVAKGSTFEVYFPRVRESTPKQTTEETPIEGGREHVLVVDDEPEVAETTRRILEMWGYTVTVRTSSVEALKLIRENPERFDMLITDLTMPQMTGDRLARETMSIRMDIPIILITGFSHSIDEERCKQLGIDGFLMKPVLPSEMARMVRRVFDGAERAEKSARLPQGLLSRYTG